MSLHAKALRCDSTETSLQNVSQGNIHSECENKDVKSISKIGINIQPDKFNF